MSCNLIYIPVSKHNNLSYWFKIFVYDALGYGVELHWVGSTHPFPEFAIIDLVNVFATSLQILPEHFGGVLPLFKDPVKDVTDD